MGGMGIVYLCYDHAENRPVALKTFKSEYLPDRAARDRFLREADTWMKLERHPHIVHAYNVVRVGDGTEVYLVLELIAKEEGRQDASLRSWLTPGQALPLEQAMLLAMQVIRGMQHATSKIPGFVHRDLKPENLLVGSDKLTNADINRLRVTDLGLASVLDELRGVEEATENDAAAFGRTQLTRGMVGTPLYMAPEQWRGDRLSAATDVYALGCIVFEMLAGERAVSGSSLSALELAHNASKRKPLPVNAPVELRAWVDRCMRALPVERYGSWSDVEVGLEAAYAALTGRRLPEAEAGGTMGRAERVAAGWAQSAVGASYLDIGKAEVAREYFERAVEVGRNEGERHLEGAALGNLGIGYYRLGKVQRAIGYYEQYLAISRETGDRQGEGNALGNLGSSYADLGEVKRAIEYYEGALELEPPIGNRRREGSLLGNLGTAYYRLGDVRRAIGFFEQQLQIARVNANHQGEAAALGNLGTAYANLGDLRHAIAYFEQALTIEREIGDRQGEGNALGSLGITHTQLGEMRRAIEFFEQRIEIAREIGDRHGQGNALGSLGTAYANLGEVRRAIGYYEQALAIAREIGDRHGQGNALGNLGTAYANIGEVRSGIGYFEQQLTIAREIGDKHGEAIGSLNTANLYRDQGDTAKALFLARHARSLFQHMGSPNAQYAEQLISAIKSGKQ